ncbi:MAG: S8 family serine peptidase [Christensenellaceae bacterium]|nr:S8 family serine peptidase [Christensenellaceae bacterium]
MKNSFKGFIACLLALLLVVPTFTGVLADSTAQVKGTLQAKDTVSVDVSGIRNGLTFEAADAAVEEGHNPNDIVSIMVELDAKPAADVCADLKAANGYREELLAAQKTAASEISKAIGAAIEVTNNYTVLFNGFAFEGEYRLVAEINKLEGVKAFVAMEWESPKLFNTTTQVGAIQAWDLDYSGEGTIVAIIDTGCKVDHPAFSVNPSNVKFSRDDIAAFINSGRLQGSNMNIANVYYSAKIPFRWNYYTNSYDVSHRSSDHGSHVAGIAAGNGGEIQGVAKDAQIAAMQVFSPTGGASWVQILAALEDCAVMGVESANLSLGSPCGSEDYWNASYGEVYERVVNAGVNLAMAAGNDYEASFNNAWGTSDITTNTWGYDGYNLVQNPDYGVVGSPSTWAHGISVAAVNNSKSRSLYVTVEGKSYGYNENAENPVLMANALGGQTVEFVVVPGVGTVEDFAQVDVNGKIALVWRGETNFTDKAANAEAAGAVACIVMNNQEGAVNMVAYEGGHIPHVIVSLAVAQILVAAEDKTMTVSEGVGIVDAIGGDQPSDFSSWGSTSVMGIKPEIIAPGGAIYSATDPTLSGALYQAWDGTSMATPHIAGGMAIISQYVNDNFPNLTARQHKEMIDIILMSTATPIYDEGGCYAAVRNQGAGEMNLAKAVTTKAYITVDGTVGNRPKLELGDDPEKTGVFSMTFTVHNFGGTALNYTIQPSVLLDDIALLGYMGENGDEPVIVYAGYSWDIAQEIGGLAGDVDGNGMVQVADAVLIARYALQLQDLDNPAMGDVDGNGQVQVADAVLASRIALGLMEPSGTPGMVNFNMPSVVTVPANGETDVTVVINLTDDCMEYLDEYYTSGAFVEGFIELMPVEEDSVSLTVPYLAYYGDWNYAPTIDLGYYYQNDYDQWNSNNYVNTIGYKKGNTIQGLGINPFINPGNMDYYYADRNAISPNGDSVLDTVNVMYMGLLRNANVRYLVIDSNGNEHVITNLGICTKGFWDTSVRDQLGVTYGAFPSNYNFAQYGTDMTIRIEAKFDNDGRHNTNAFTTEASSGWKWDIPLHIDTTMPTVNNFSASGSNFSFNVTDDHYVAYAAVYTNNGGALGTLVSQIGVFEYTRGATTAITLQGSADNYVVVGDYAGNASVYLWNGSTLTPVNVEVDPNPSLPGNYEDCYIYAYGLNLTTTQWTLFDTTDIASLYNGESTPSGLDIVAAAYDANHGYVYAYSNNGHMYRYTMGSNGMLGSRQDLGLSPNYYNEMAYDNAHDILFGISGAVDLVTIDVNTLTEELVAQITWGCVAMDFGADGMMYQVDAYGCLNRIDLFGSGSVDEIADLGFEPVNMNTGSFYNQSGCMIGNTFYWGAISAAQTKDLIRVDVTNGAFESMGLVLSSPGLQMTGMFAVSYDNMRSEANFCDFTGTINVVAE